MGTRGTGRRRSMKAEKTTAEEEALNLISAQAEAKLAAKRAARAEAREIRLQELERQQREVQDEDYSDEGSGAPSVSSPPPGGTSCQPGAGGTCGGNGSSSLNNEGMLAEVQEKYRKAMVSNAQLDNEKNKLMFVVDVLKDSLLELEELLSESRREYEDKVKEHEQEKLAHRLLMLQFREMKDSLKQHQEMLTELRNKQAASVQDVSDLQHTLEWKDKRIQALERQKEFAEENRLECNDELREDASMEHGVMLKPSLSVNGAAAAPAGVRSGDADGGVLGSPAEAELRSPREEDVDPQHPEEEAENGGEHPWSSEMLQKHVDTSALPEEPHWSVESGLSVDSTVVTCSAEDGDAPQTQVQSAVNTGDVEKKDTSRMTPEEQEPKQSHVHQHNSLPRPELHVEEVLQSEPNCEAQPSTAEREGGEKMEEKANKPQPSSTSGKKKKKKRGKRKGGSHDNKNQQETRAGNEIGANKTLKEEEADIKDVGDTLKAEEEEESGTIEASVTTKTLQETNMCSASGEHEKTTEEEGAAEDLKDHKSVDEEKTGGTLHPKQEKPENAATLSEGCFQTGALEEPPTDPMFVDREDKQTPETEEPGVRPEEEASCPDEEETSSSDVSELILQKSSAGLDLIHVSAAAEESEASGTQSSLLSLKDDAAGASSSSESCSGGSGSEKPSEGVAEEEHGGHNIPQCATTSSHDEDSEATDQPPEQTLTEEAGSELDPPTQTEGVSSASDLEPSLNGTCQDRGAEPRSAGPLELEETSAASEPQLEKGQHSLESESSPSHVDQSKSFRSPSKDPERGEAVNVTSADTKTFTSYQSDSEEEPGHDHLSGGEEFRGSESDTGGQEKLNSSLSCEATAEKLEDTSKKPANQNPETHAVKTKELRGSADSLGQTEPSDPLRQKDRDCPNLSEPAGGSTEAPLDGKDAKKSSRKGKGKSKEECKMS
ncbi:hypothetical protein OJAV_G00167820 [Oryzias javanicus]|uniref:Uncharacterized protein n=1 Tax=Oryzias javanicus TaxID=123683 RepID=A0A3S2PHG1_ORYJA|nr:hypothetical protein OJAV_G00167820 [Oryzias javanicus]